jgi:CheY-like chemotaxis protein
MQVVAAVAAAAAAGTPFDVCVMDMYMERVNGDVSLTSLRAAGHALPVVLCTANATLAEAERYRTIGFCGVLGKPFTTEEMSSAIAGAVGPRCVGATLSSTSAC